MMEIRWALTPVEEIPAQLRAPRGPYLPGILRKCTDCGREARDESMLAFFTKREEAPHGRANLCKNCRNARTRIKKKRVWC